MHRLLFAAMQSGGGKTAVTCAFLAALKGRGLSPRAFKCGPDYIDPMFHRRVLEVPSYNLDLFLSPASTVRGMLNRHGKDGAAVLEGVMGFYDGVGGTDRASTWRLARETETPVVLVVRPKGASLTLAAQIRGMLSFREDSQIRGLFLNDCGAKQYASLAPLLERETGLPVLGFLPHLPEADWESRHLGLVTADELRGWRERTRLLGEQMERTGNVDGLLALAEKALPLDGAEARLPPAGGKARIAVARDEAFCFLYDDNLELLEDLGAELLYFSPLKDLTLPEGAEGLYLPGGYPELYARELSHNTEMLRAVSRVVESGMPTVAECGGFLYLQQSLEDRDGTPWPMAGALHGNGIKTERLQRFGYAELTARRDNLLLRAGEKIPVHEFHYWDCTENGKGLEAVKPAGGAGWSCGVTGSTLFAGFPHLYFYARPEMAYRFLEAAARYGKERKQ